MLQCACASLLSSLWPPSTCPNLETIRRKQLIPDALHDLNLKIPPANLRGAWTRETLQFVDEWNTQQKMKDTRIFTVKYVSIWGEANKRNHTKVRLICDSYGLVAFIEESRSLKDFNILEIPISSIEGLTMIGRASEVQITCKPISCRASILYDGESINIDRMELKADNDQDGEIFDHIIKLQRKFKSSIATNLRPGGTEDFQERVEIAKELIQTPETAPEIISEQSPNFSRSTDILTGELVKARVLSGQLSDAGLLTTFPNPFIIESDSDIDMAAFTEANNKPPDPFPKKGYRSKLHEVQSRTEKDFKLSNGLDKMPPVKNGKSSVSKNWKASPANVKRLSKPMKQYKSSTKPKLSSSRKTPQGIGLQNNLDSSKTDVFDVQGSSEYESPFSGNNASTESPIKAMSKRKFSNVKEAQGPGNIGSKKKIAEKVGIKKPLDLFSSSKRIIELRNSRQKAPKTTIPQQKVPSVQTPSGKKAATKSVFDVSQSDDGESQIALVLPPRNTRKLQKPRQIKLTNEDHQHEAIVIEDETKAFSPKKLETTKTSRKAKQSQANGRVYNSENKVDGMFEPNPISKVHAPEVQALWPPFIEPAEGARITAHPAISTALEMQSLSPDLRKSKRIASLVDELKVRRPQIVQWSRNGPKTPVPFSTAKANENDSKKLFSLSIPDSTSDRRQIRMANVDTVLEEPITSESGARADVPAFNMYSDHLLSKVSSPFVSDDLQATRESSSVEQVYSRLDNENDPHPVVQAVSDYIRDRDDPKKKVVWIENPMHGPEKLRSLFASDGLALKQFPTGPDSPFTPEVFAEESILYPLPDNNREVNWHPAGVQHLQQFNEQPNQSISRMGNHLYKDEKSKDTETNESPLQQHFYSIPSKFFEQSLGGSKIDRHIDRPTRRSHLKQTTDREALSSENLANETTLVDNSEVSVYMDQRSPGVSSVYRNVLRAFSKVGKKLSDHLQGEEQKVNNHVAAVEKAGKNIRDALLKSHAEVLTHRLNSFSFNIQQIYTENDISSSTKSPDRRKVEDLKSKTSSQHTRNGHKIHEGLKAIKLRSG